MKNNYPPISVSLKRSPDKEGEEIDKALLFFVDPWYQMFSRSSPSRSSYVSAGRTPRTREMVIMLPPLTTVRSMVWFGLVFSSR